MTKKLLLLFICIFILGIFTTACGGGGKATPPNNPFFPIPNPTPAPEKYDLELSQTEFTVNVGETDNITVTLNGQDITQTATYTVDQEAIASVEQGLITGLSVGVAIVTVHAENAIEDKTFTVNVIDPSLPTLEVEPSEFNLFVGDESNVKVTLEGEDVTEKVDYKSDNKSIATAEKGVVNAKYTGGTANIAVSLEGANSAILKVNVTDDSKTITLDENILALLGYERVYKGDYKYDIKKIADGEIVKNLEIPATFTCSGTKYKITSIGIYTFENCTLESVIIPDSVISIETYAFSSCSSLKEIHIGEGVLCIFPSAFKACDKLTQLTTKSGTIDIPDGFLIDNDNNVTFIYAKQDTSEVEGDITIPEGVINIPYEAFYKSSLESITLPDSVVSIGTSAFSCCSLRSITLTDSVTSIGTSAFYNCSKLKEIHIGDGVLCIFPEAFMDCNNLTQLTTKSGTIDIPSSNDENQYYTEGNVTFIYVKKYKPTIDSYITISIPEGVTEIPYRAFYMSSLGSITIPDSVTSIGTEAFNPGGKNSENFKLKSVTIGENSSLTTIGTSAFYNSLLESITIPESVICIGMRAFEECRSLKSVTFGENSSLTTIGSCAFVHCGQNDGSLILDIPSTVTSIGPAAFESVNNINISDAQKELDGCPWGALQVNGE